MPQKLSGLVCVYHPAAPGSNPKHTILAFFIYSQNCTIALFRPYLKKIERSITTVCRNKAIWLVVTSHMTIFNPKECIIQHSKVMLCKNLFMILTLGQKCLSWTVTVATTGSRHQYFRIAQFRYPKICLWHRLWDSNPWASDLKSRHRPRSRRCRRRQICK